RIVAEIARVQHAYGIALASLDGFGDPHAADGGANHLVDVGDANPDPRGALAIDGDVDVEAAGRTVGECAARALDLRHHLLDLDGGALDRLQVVAEDFDAERAADARRQHLGARLHRHPPEV